MATATELHNRIRQIVAATHTRSPLSTETVDLEAVDVVRLEIPALWSPNVSTPVPTSTIIRYSTDAPQPTIPGFEREIDLLRRLAAEPVINRLNNVQQLSTTSFSSSLGGSHSRLEHTLGAFDTAIRLLRAANAFMLNAQHEQPGRYPDRDRFLKVHAALVLAFFHDAFHPPFGHVLDPLRPILLPGVDNSRIDNALKILEFEEAATGDGTIYRLLCDRVYPRQLLDEIVQEAISLLRADAVVYDDNDALPLRYGFLLDILWGPLDHDRLDYLPRDAAHVYAFGALPPNLSELETSIAFVEDNSGQTRLVFKDAVGRQLETLLLLRQHMYSDVYEGRIKAAYDELILHSVILCFDAHEQFRQRLRLAQDSPEWKIGVDFARLSDVDLIRLLSEQNDEPKAWLSKALLRNLLTNSPFVPAATADINNLDIPYLGLRYIYWRAPLHQRLRKARAAFRRVHDKKLIEAAYRDIAKMLLEDAAPVDREELRKAAHTLDASVEHLAEKLDRVPPTKSEAMFWVLITFSLHAYHRFELERWMWGEFRRKWEGFEPWAAELCLKYAQDATEGVSYGDSRARDEAQQAASTAMYETLRETPLIFVFMTRMVPESVTGMWLKDNVLERDALTVDKKGQLSRVTTRPRHSENNYWLAVFRPPTMDNSADMVLREILAGFLHGGWIEQYVFARMSVADEEQLHPV